MNNKKKSIFIIQKDALDRIQFELKAHDQTNLLKQKLMKIIKN